MCSPVQVLHEELQGFVMRRRQLPQEVFHFEEDMFELHADRRRIAGGAAARRLHLLHDDALTLLRQADEVVIVTEEDERLGKLTGENTQTFTSFRYFIHLEKKSKIYKDTGTCL